MDVKWNPDLSDILQIAERLWSWDIDLDNRDKEHELLDNIRAERDNNNLCNVDDLLSELWDAIVEDLEYCIHEEHKRDVRTIHYFKRLAVEE